MGDIVVGTNRDMTVAEAVIEDDAVIVFGDHAGATNHSLAEFDAMEDGR